MKTIDKCMRVLQAFSFDKTEIGLTELSKLSGLDKAATRRILIALIAHDFIEQNPKSRQYFLGSGFLRLAKVREATLSIEDIIQSSLDSLTQLTNETSHASLLRLNQLQTARISFPARSSRIHLEDDEILPFHATSSGLTFLSFAEDAPERFLSEQLPSYTRDTILSQETILKEIEKIQLQGFGIGLNGYEDDVTGIAVPIFDANQSVIGTLAVATPTSRFSDDLIAHFSQALFKETQIITQTLGGTIPEHYVKLFDQNDKSDSYQEE